MQTAKRCLECGDPVKTLFGQFARFLLVGGLATVVHYALLVTLVQSDAFGPVPASGVGFVCSAVLNYWLSHRYTFKSTQGHAVAIPRFVVVATAGLLINQAVVSATIGWLELHYFMAQVIATACVMTWNFILSRVWTFGGNRQLKHGS